MPTRGDMQHMINSCTSYGKEFSISFNFKKTKLMIFGKVHDFINNCSYLGDGVVALVKKWKYLGFTLLSCEGLKLGFSPDLASYCRIVY